MAIGDKFREDVKYGIRSKVEYCKRHGYDFIQDDSKTDYTRHLAWSKIPAILEYLPKYDYLVWIDADTLIMNPEKKLEDFISKLMLDNQLMYVASLNWVNTGVMFIKNTQFMKAFMAQSWHHTDQICWEQGAIDLLYRTDWLGCQKVIKVIPDQTEFNSLWHQFKWGQFLVHFPGCGEKGRPENCLKRMMDMFCTLKMDEESWETYLKRLETLRTVDFSQEYAKNWKYFPLV